MSVGDKVTRISDGARGKVIAVITATNGSTFVKIKWSTGDVSLHGQSKVKVDGAS